MKRRDEDEQCYKNRQRTNTATHTRSSQDNQGDYEITELPNFLLLNLMYQTCVVLLYFDMMAMVYLKKIEGTVSLTIMNVL